MSKSPKDTHGPVVNTGRTAGRNRSKNKDGRWRAKRSDTGKSRKSGNSGGSGCFISTVACQFRGLADNCYELEVLRGFRDGYLMTTEHGRKMVEHYYSIAPSIAKSLVQESDLNQAWDALVACVQSIESGRYGDAISIYRSMVESLRARR